MKNYNSLKNSIWQGDQYRLSNPREEPIASVAYISKDKASGVLFNYLVGNRYGDGSVYPIHLKGLDSKALYSLEEINLYPGVSSSIDSEKKYSGEFLMTVGFNPVVNSGRSSVVLKLTRRN